MSEEEAFELYGLWREAPEELKGLYRNRLMEEAGIDPEVLVG